MAASVVATDYVRAFADQIRAFVPVHYTVLGTDGFGRYDIAQAAIEALAKEGKMTGKDVARAIKQYKIDVEKVNPVGV